MRVMKNNKLVEWGCVVDNHLMGVTPLGKVFIRMNRQEKVTGMYTMFDEIEKFTPQDEFQEDIDLAKEVLSEIVKGKIEKDIFLKKELTL